MEDEVLPSGTDTGGTGFPTIGTSTRQIQALVSAVKGKCFHRGRRADYFLKAAQERPGGQC